MVSVLDEKALYWQDKEGVKIETREVPAELKEELSKAREELIEKVSGLDDALMEKYLNNETPSIEELKLGIRKAVIANKLVPVYCGSSLRNKGVQPVLDGIVDFLPSPLDLPPVEGVNPKTGQEEKREASPEAPFCALAFKVQTDPHVGKLPICVFIREN